MKYIISFVLFFVVCLNAFAQETDVEPVVDPVSPFLKTIYDLDIIFTDVNIVSLNHERTYRDMVVIVVGNRIHMVNSMESIETSGSGQVIPAGGKYLLAGMLPYEWLDSQYKDMQIDRSFERFKMYGDVTPGNLANLVLLPANPLETSMSVGDIEGIMVRGIWYGLDQLSECFEELKQLYP